MLFQDNGINELNFDCMNRLTSDWINSGLIMQLLKDSNSDIRRVEKTTFYTFFFLRAGA